MARRLKQVLQPDHNGVPRLWIGIETEDRSKIEGKKTCVHAISIHVLQFQHVAYKEQFYISLYCIVLASLLEIEPNPF